MVKIIVDTKSKENSEIKIEGSTIPVIEELAHGLNIVLKEIKFHDCETISDRIDLLHGALLADLLINGHDIHDILGL